MQRRVGNRPRELWRRHISAETGRSSGPKRKQVAQALGLRDGLHNNLASASSHTLQQVIPRHPEMEADDAGRELFCAAAPVGVGRCAAAAGGPVALIEPNLRIAGQQPYAPGRFAPERGRRRRAGQEVEVDRRELRWRVTPMLAGTCRALHKAQANEPRPPASATGGSDVLGPAMSTRRMGCSTANRLSSLRCGHMTSPPIVGRRRRIADTSDCLPQSLHLLEALGTSRITAPRPITSPAASRKDVRENSTEMRLLSLCKAGTASRSPAE